jgi:SPP1 family phage portal protein
MEDLIAELISDPKSAIATIKLKSKDFEKITEYRKEFKEFNRELRPTQVGIIQKDKVIGNGEKSKLVKAVRIPINFAKKIVTTSTAFEVGKPVTLIPSVESELSKLIALIWKTNRIDSMIQKLVSLCKTETQGALNFYISDIKQEGLFNKILAALKLKASKEIKVKLLDNTSGTMTPYFDAIGNMILFMWEYKTVVNGKTINNVQIWDEKLSYICNDTDGSFKLISKLPHGFDRIPMVYVSQEQPEWFDVKDLIDRFEVAISKGGGANDRTAHPILAIIGEISSLPDANDDGKVINLTKKVDDNGNIIQSEAKFLESSGGNESHKNELELIWKLIFSISQTPDLSFDNLKSLGNVSGVALKLMFLDAIIKATMNEGDNRTMIERIINIIMSGIVTTTNTSMKTSASELYYDINFNSILPDDLASASDIIIKLKEAGLLSSESAIKMLDIVENPVDELNKINKEKPEAVQQTV